MFGVQLFKIATKSLLINRSRSALTILGIVIGIAAIIMVMSVGKSTEGLILNQIRSLGSELIFVEPGREASGPGDFSQFFAQSLKPADLEALKDPARVRFLRDITPLVLYSGFIAGNGESKAANVVGVSGEFFPMLDDIPDNGRIFSEDEIKSFSSVIILGNDVKESIFGQSDAIGQKIKVKNVSFRVIGVFGPRGRRGNLDMDKIAFVPYTTSGRYLTGTSHFNEIIARSESERTIGETAEDIRLTLRESHGITDPSKDDFHVMTPADIMKRIGVVMNILTALLVAVAAVSLVVGGIGIMNIMLVSVSERTREIGLRKAIGATGDHILSQFLVEATILTALGGILGIIVGGLFSFAVSLIFAKSFGTEVSFIMPVSAIVLGLGVSAFVGIVFGIYPARRAAKKHPIEALRYE